MTKAAHSLHRLFGRSALLLYLALTVLLLIPIAAPAQTAPAPDPQPLPDAPATIAGTIPSRSPRPYIKPTPHEDLMAYRHELIGPRPFIAAAIRSGIEQARTVPVGWGQDFPGYLQRYGSAYGEEAIDSSVRFGLAAAFHEDVRYLVCHGCPVGDKLENAVLAEFTARHGDDGHRSVSATPIVAGLSGPLIAYTAWYPPGYGPSQALHHAAFGFSTRIVFHIVREFLFDKNY